MTSRLDADAFESIRRMRSASRLAGALFVALLSFASAPPKPLPLIFDGITALGSALRSLTPLLGAGLGWTAASAAFPIFALLALRRRSEALFGRLLAADGPEKENLRGRLRMNEARLRVLARGA